VTVLVLAAAAAFGCKDQGPVAGELSVRLSTPRFNDRAILFRVVGRQHGVAATTGMNYRVLSDTSAAGDTTWIAVIALQGSYLASGEIARLAVPDVRKAGDYTAVVSDLASSTYAALDVTTVSVTFVKP
jgi:hypothetical protein